MVYMGSKNRIAKELLPIITASLKENQYYVEPFVGGCNMIDKVQHPNKIGADNNKYLIALLKYVQDGNELPLHIEKEEYQKVKANPATYDDWYVGYVGFIASHNGKFFNGYAGITNTKQGERNYLREKRNNLLKQDLSSIRFECCSYDELEIPDNSVIYCDPPYQDTTSYKDKFDSCKFWNWVRDMAEAGHQIYVSEYNAPEDFTCIWEKEVSSSLSKSNKKSAEKLFVYDKQDC